MEFFLFSRQRIWKNLERAVKLNLKHDFRHKFKLAMFPERSVRYLSEVTEKVSENLNFRNKRPKF